MVTEIKMDVSASATVSPRPLRRNRRFPAPRSVVGITSYQPQLYPESPHPASKRMTAGTIHHSTGVIRACMGFIFPVEIYVNRSSFTPSSI